MVAMKAAETRVDGRKPAPGIRERPQILTLLALPALLALGGCCCSDLEAKWRTSIARQTLECLHPTGIFESTGAVSCECESTGCELAATLYWRGRATDSNYLTKVRVRAADGVGLVYVIEDTSIVPAASSCRVPVPDC